MSRTKNVLRNSAWGIIYRLVTMVGPFLIKTIIIHQLGIQYNGLNGLFTSILTVLNLTNLGFSSSLVYMMYKAVADDDKEALSAMLNYFKKVHRIVGSIILIMGLALLPFLNLFVKGEVPSDLNLHILFVIFLLEVVFDYILFSYNTSLFTAYQREDITLKIQTVRYIFQYIIQALILVVFKNYYLYAIFLPIMVILNSIGYQIKARKEYPDIICRGLLSARDKQQVYQKVFTLFGHNLGNTFLVSVDSIIISAYLGLTSLSIYSNYNYVQTAVNGLIQVFSGGSLSAIGNKLITDTRESNYKFFLIMHYIWLGLVGISTAFMLCLFQPFIVVWAGQKYLLTNFEMYFVVLYFYAWVFRVMTLTYRNAAGLWTKDWLKPYIGMIINVVGSIWMIQATQSIIGVLVPTIFVFFFIYFPWEAYVVIKYKFNTKGIEFFSKIVYLIFVTLIGCLLSYYISINLFYVNNFRSFVLRFFIVLLVFPIIWILTTFRMSEFKYIIQRIMIFVKSKLLK
ncbi:oligosaccharide flippase family protein [Helcococcus ovis]|uniref:Polysaccharide biosynthesis protein n=3 Tax=Helcococcus ovis TaxID=72026 RepID=A0A4R9C4A0_9FIRM|nr:oligosaccharide flippase family protein [Helcococcus ovis]TFF64114.1 polysaccharide biosynthesis protein [Helcococcus ovis]TFF66765.1 polysaccharide biosynthesis protein [Helcococcus ovis]TFF68210.1 polysaccharide biosynthesis protein [Helcococcus ovis]WNZ01511.1 oligosaccharide flippase family protein [Helcococcus ovis]